MMRIAFAFIVFFVSVGIPSAYGQDTCGNGFPMGSGSCAALDSDGEYKKADKALNETYKDLLKDLKSDLPASSDALKSLAPLQRQWLQFRDAWCKQVRKNFKGLDQWGIAQEEDCLTELTKHRIEELKNYEGNG